MKTTRDFRFPVSIGWAGGRLVRATVPGKEPLALATPPEFKGTDVGVWSPEDALVAATASCFSVTYLAVAERRGIPVHDVAVDGVGRMGLGEDGRLGFLGIDLTAHLVTEPGHEEAAVAAAERAEQGCFVSMALAIPVRLETHVRTAAGAAA
jgi:organic hydroperoxide reductase OsmC/OhrA